MNLLRTLVLCAAADVTVVAGKSSNEDVDADRYALHARNLGTGSRDDGHKVMEGAEYVGDLPDEYDDMEWETKDVNDVLGVEKEIASRLERQLSSQYVKADSPKKRTNQPILKGQSTRELEEDEEEFEYEYEYDYELEELLTPGDRDLSHLRGKARKRGKRAKRKNGTKKGKKGKKRGKKGKKGKKRGKKKKQDGRYKFSSNNNGGVYNFGTNGVVGNNQHNNLFDDNNRRAVCLEPADPYRTCYTRSDDANSKLNRDYIDRSGYNFGVKLYRQGYTYVDPDYLDPAYNTPLEPYTKPYTKSNERLVSTSIWMTLLQDSTNVNCDAQISMEETALEYLKDNVGGPNTYEPVCVFVKNSAYEKQDVLDGSGDTVESTVLELEVTYVMKDSYYQQNRRLGELIEEEQWDLELENQHEDRELARSRCGPQARAACQSATAFNTPGRFLQSCKRKGCGRGGGRNNRALATSKFNTLVRASTPFKPEETNALLDMENINDVATCSTNRYAIEVMDDATTLTCDQFGDYGCMSKNDDLLPVLTERNGGCGSTTYFPTVFPTAFPTALFPTTFPTSTTLVPTAVPTNTPTELPILSPTLEPTEEINIKPKVDKRRTENPTVEPTNTPTELPTIQPSLVPTVSPTIQPSLIPTLSPSVEPTFSTSLTPTGLPTLSPTGEPTFSPSVEPTFGPTLSPTIEPTLSPTNDPTKKPTKPSDNKLFKDKGEKKKNDRKKLSGKNP